MKFVSFAKAAQVSGRAAFQAWLISEFAPRFMAANGDLEGLAIDVVDRTPGKLPYTPITSASSGRNLDHAPAYDAVVHVWLPSVDRFRTASESWAGHAGICHSFQASEIVIWSDEPAALGALPGLKYLGLLEFHDDLTDSAIRRSWAHHTKLARRAHPGATKYLQNWLTPLDADAPPAKGISELYLPRISESFDNFFDSVRGRQEITHETAHFVKGGPRLYATEHVFRLPPASAADGR